MRTPGVEVRPLRQITGHAHFNEVFLSDVRVPAENVVGAVNGGWAVAHTTMANERTLIGGSGGGVTPEQVFELARRTGAASDPVIRQDLASFYMRTQLLRYMNYRVQTALSHGRQPGPEAATTKLFVSQHMSATGDLFMEIEGAAGMLSGESAIDGGLWQTLFLNQWMSKLGGGTDNIQRNSLGEMVLGLPREPRTDKDVPFSSLGARS
jgi:alkylation response protein AidB-like acyl-CoA dehydrogenase